MTKANPKSSIQIDYETLEHVFNRYANNKAHESNRHPVGDPSRVEHDLNEVEKAHLALLQSKIHATIAQEFLRSMATSAEESSRLGTKVFWLNVTVAALTAVMAITAILQLLKP